MKDKGCKAYPGSDRDEEWCEYAQYLDMCKGCEYCDGREISNYQKEKIGAEGKD